MMCLVRRQSSGCAARAAASGAVGRQATGSTAAGTSEAARGHPAAPTGDVAGTPAGSNAVLVLHLLDAAGAAGVVSAAVVALVGTLAAAAATGPGAACVSRVAGAGTYLLLIGHGSAADHLPAAGNTLSHSCRVQWGGLARGWLQRARRPGDRQQAHPLTTGRLQGCRWCVAHATCRTHCNTSCRQWITEESQPPDSTSIHISTTGKGHLLQHAMGGHRHSIIHFGRPFSVTTSRRCAH